MAMNTFDALMAEVNRKISEVDTAASQANAAAALANEAAQNADEQVHEAEAVIEQAKETAENTQTTAQAWENAQAEAATVQAGGEAKVTITQSEGVKKLLFAIPCGADGEAGEKGDMGRSGVTFSLVGTKLYITTE